MGRDGNGGVELRANSIRVHFTYAGKGRKETLKSDGKVLAPTPANEKHARRLVAEIKQKVRFGIFNYADYFPDSKTARELHSSASVVTLKQAATAWMQSKGQLKGSSLAQYQSAVNCWLGMLGEDTPMPKITEKVLKVEIGKFPWPSPKAHNNYMIALRGIFALEYGTSKNPTENLQNMKVTKRQPDPLTLAERDKVLNRMRERFDVRVWAYFAFMFFTGMRPEEAIALRWSDIDWDRRQIMVQRVRTFKGSEWDDPKTYRERVVDLVPEAMDALKAMRAYTLVKRDEEGQPVDVFENPITGKAWHDERSQRDTYWKPTLKALHIRERRAYCTRHTYCTIALMGRVNPSYVAAQAGHSVQMLLSTYAKWIPGNDDGAERRALEAVMARKSSPELPRTG